MKIFISILFFIPVFAFGQIQLERQVISPIAINGGSVIQISSTGGQIEYTTESSSDYILTQGFEQENIKLRTIQYFLEEPTCNDGSPWILTILLDSVCTSGLGLISVNGFSEEVEIEIETPGTYEIEINCNSGSNFNAEILIEDEDLPGCDLVFYNVITPSNDVPYWHIENIEHSNFNENSVTIFNRWGKPIWEAEHYNNNEVRWEGTSEDGTILTQGTYYYVVEVNGAIFKGFIELIR